MNVRFAQLNSLLRIAGVAAIVCSLGATAPAKKATPAPTPARAATVKPVAAPAAELMRNAIPAAATLGPAGITRKLRVLRMEVTAYCPCKKCCGENAQGITASGFDVSYNNSRFVAADTERLPFGTQLIIPGYAGAPVEVIDKGGAIKGNKLDVYFPTHEEALQWGRQFLTVTIVE